LFNTLVGGALGLVIALVLVRLLDALDDRTHPARSAEKRLHHNNHQGSDTTHLTERVVGEKSDSHGGHQAC
jgi:hypothetical protein